METRQARPPRLFQTDRLGFGRGVLWAFFWGGLRSLGLGFRVSGFRVSGFRGLGLKFETLCCSVHLKLLALVSDLGFLGHWGLVNPKPLIPGPKP